jgi:DsbC/DsbD-like thiol-disulfide interchange protein
MFKTLIAAMALSLVGGTTLAQERFNLDDIAKVDLIAGWKLENGTYMGGVRITLAPGWKTYWRVGGETGIPPQFDWTGSKNLDGVKIHWPRPDILTVSGLDVVGYKNEVVFPIEFTPTKTGESIDLTADMQLGVCSDICVPVNVPLDLTLDAKPGVDGFLIELALADLAVSGDELGYRLFGCTLTAVEDGYKMQARIALPKDAKKSRFVVFELPNPDVWVAPSTFTRVGDEILAETLILSYGDAGFTVNPDDLRITMISKKQAVDLRGCPAAS